MKPILNLPALRPVPALTAVVLRTRTREATALMPTRAPDLAASALWRRRSPASDGLFWLAADAYRVTATLEDRRKPRFDIVL